MKRLNSLILIIATTCLACAQQKESEVKAELPKLSNYTIEVVIPDITNPWGMVFLPDNSILFTEKHGELFHFKDNKKIPIEGLPEIYNRGQGGLMDLELHPNYKENGWVYISYASKEGEGDGGNTAIMRAKLEGNKLVENELLYKATPNTKKGQHWGSRIEFDNEGYMYFSVGDRGQRDVNPQDITRDGGKIYRLHDDGRIPKDNPFANVDNAKKAIYSYGHRNPQGLIKHPITGEIWEHEHGPKGGDEINIIKKSKNYGWPVISYGINYSGTTFTDITHKKDMKQPLFYWVPSIAPCGMTFVTSDIYHEWKGNLLVGSLKFKYLERLVIEDGEVIKREKLFENTNDVRNVRQAPDGYIYFSIEGKGIVKIVPKK